MAKRTDTTVKVDVEAVALAKIAASFKRMTLAEYVSWLIAEHSPGIIAHGAAELAASDKVPRRPGKPAGR